MSAPATQVQVYNGRLRFAITTPVSWLSVHTFCCWIKSFNSLVGVIECVCELMMWGRLRVCGPAFGT